MLSKEIESLAHEDKISSVAFLESVSEKGRVMTVELTKPLEMMQPRCNESVTYRATVKHPIWRNLFRQLTVAMQEEQRILVVFEAIYCGLAACYYMQEGNYENLPLYDVELRMVNRAWVGNQEKSISLTGNAVTLCDTVSC